MVWKASKRARSGVEAKEEEEEEEEMGMDRWSERRRAAMAGVLVLAPRPS